MSDSAQTPSATLLQTSPPPLALGVNFNASRTSYDSDPGINQSKIKLFLNSPTPAHYHHDLLHPKDAAHFRIGNAIDLLCFKPNDFYHQFIVWDGDRKQGKKWDEFKERAESLSLTVLSLSEMDQIKGMVAGLQRCADAANIIEKSHRQVALVANDQGGRRLKCLLDFFPEYHPTDTSEKWLFDLKTTSRGADPRNFNRQAEEIGYFEQAVFYMALANLCGINVSKFGFIVVETFAPYECAIHWISKYSEEAERAAARIQDGLGRLKACIDSGKWPGYPSDWTEMKASRWYLNPKEAEYRTIA
jgi:hypothetical protein